MDRYLELDAAMPHGSGSGSGSGNAVLNQYTLPQAAAILGMSERTLRSRVVRGEIAAARTGRGHYRIAGETLEELRQRQDAVRQPLGMRQRQDAAAAITGNVSSRDARVEQLEAEVAFLRETIRDLRLLLLAQAEPAHVRTFRNAKPAATGRLPDVSLPRPEPAPSPRWRWWRPLRGLAAALGM